MAEPKPRYMPPHTLARSCADRQHAHGRLATDPEFTLTAYLKGVAACLVLAAAAYGFCIIIGG